MEMMIPKCHGKRGVFENILKSDDLVHGDERDDIKARVTVKR